MDSRDMSDDVSARDARKRSRRKFWKLVLFTIFLMYPNVSSHVLRYFVCRRVDDVDYLSADFTIQCYQGRWSQYSPAAIIFIFVYPVGIPLLFAYFLHRYRKRLNEPGVKAQLGFLVGAYHQRFYLFECVDMINKLFMTSIVAFFAPDIQMPAAMAFTVAYMIVILVVNPYIHSSDDVLHLLVQVLIYLIVLCAYIINHSATNQLDYYTDRALSAVLIILSILVFMIFMLSTLRHFRSMCLKRQRRKQRLLSLQNRPSHLQISKPDISQAAAAGDNAIATPTKKLHQPDPNVSPPAYPAHEVSVNMSRTATPSMVLQGTVPVRNFRNTQSTSRPLLPAEGETMETGGDTNDINDTNDTLDTSPREGQYHRSQPSMTTSPTSTAGFPPTHQSTKSVMSFFSTSSAGSPIGATGLPPVGPSSHTRHQSHGLGLGKTAGPPAHQRTGTLSRLFGRTTNATTHINPNQLTADEAVNYVANPHVQQQTMTPDETQSYTANPVIQATQPAPAPAPTHTKTSSNASILAMDVHASNTFDWNTNPYANPSSTNNRPSIG